MNIKEALRELPAALKAVIAERPNYAKSIRHSHWTEGPVILLAQGTALNAARAGAEALEWLLGWPSLARETAEFLHYSAALLRPRVTVIVVSRGGEDEDAVEIARRAARQGANVLALTSDPESSLAKTARAYLRLPALEDSSNPIAGSIAEQAALFEIATAAAKVFNPRNPHSEPAEAGLDKMPEQVLWMQTHLRDPIHACVTQLSQSSRLVIAGGHFYRHAAAQAAALSRRAAGRSVEALETHEFLPSSLNASDAVLLVSGSKSRDKKGIHGLAEKLKDSPAKVLSITDANDGDLIGLSEFSMLIPELPEIPGSLLSLSLLDWLILAWPVDARSTPAERPAEAT